MMTFWNNLESYGHNPCVEGEMSLCYQDVAKLADKVFSNKAKADNNKVLALVVCGRDVATFLAYLGCLRTGVVPILLPEDMGPAGITAYISRYQPRYLICKKSLYSDFAPQVGRILNEVYDSVVVELGDISYGISDVLGLLLTTSGTTADPKLVRLSYHNLQANADSIAECLQITDISKPITLLPFNYSFGLSVINSHLNRGAAIVFTSEGLASRGFWDAFKQYNVSSFYGVPYHYEILQKLRFQRLNYPSLTLMAQAGGRMSDALKQQFFEISQTKGFKFVCMYGQTEATARISYLPADKFESKAKSVGIAIPNGKLSIKHADANGIGEVSYQGPNVSLGYATAKEDFAQGDANRGELITGDLGYLDADGYLYLTGRKKRYVKVFGHNVNLDHLESIVCELVAEAAVIGQDNQIKVLTTQGKAEDIKKALISKTTIQPSSLVIQDVKTLIYKSSGKIDYGMLTKWYLEND